METTELTLGQQWVGKTFNPSKDPAVDRAKNLAAELVDMAYAAMPASAADISFQRDLLFRQVLGEILNAQMNLVKLLTFQY